MNQYVEYFAVCRYYQNRSGMAIMKMVDAEFNYTYEYQGNAPKLVHTPLTDKCYLTLTQGKPVHTPLTDKCYLTLTQGKFGQQLKFTNPISHHRTVLITSLVTTDLCWSNIYEYIVTVQLFQCHDQCHGRWMTLRMKVKDVALSRLNRTINRHV